MDMARPELGPFKMSDGTPRWQGALAQARRTQLLNRSAKLAQYIDKKALFELLRNKEVRLITPKFILEQNDKSLPLPKFQDVPEGGFVDVDALQADGTLDQLEIITISYCWLTKDHPDPEGYHLATVAALARRFVEGSYDDANDTYHMPNDEGCFVTGQKGCPKRWLNNRAYTFGAGDGRPVGVFLDWCSLPQDKPHGSRTPSDTAIFKRALNNINLWYAHQHTIMWMLSYLPPTSTRSNGYHASGWTTFEHSVGSIISQQHHLLDIDAEIREGLMGSRFAEDDYIQVSLYAMDMKRCAPLTPERFGSADVILQKNFTNGADMNTIVIPGYLRTFEAAIAGAKTLEFQNLGFDDAEAEKVMDVTRDHCKGRLRELDLASNQITVPLAKWAGYVKEMSLHQLVLSRNREITGDVVLFSAQTQLVELRLDATRVCGDLATLGGLTNLSVLNLDGTKTTGDISFLARLTKLTEIGLWKTGVSGDIGIMSGLTLLKKLGLNDTKVQGDIVVLRRMTNLTVVYLNDTQVSGNIKELAGLHDVADIYLHRSGISGDIGSLAGLAKLTALNVRSTDVTGNIAGLATLSTLRDLDLTGSKVAGDIGALDKTLLQCKIKWVGLEARVNAIRAELDIDAECVFEVPRAANTLLGLAGDGTFPEQITAIEAYIFG